jgi:hypothetical protein
MLTELPIVLKTSVTLSVVLGVGCCAVRDGRALRADAFQRLRVYPRLFIIVPTEVPTAVSIEYCLSGEATFKLSASRLMSGQCGTRQD